MNRTTAAQRATTPVSIPVHTSQALQRLPHAEACGISFALDQLLAQLAQHTSSAVGVASKLSAAQLDRLLRLQQTAGTGRRSQPAGWVQVRIARGTALRLRRLGAELALRSERRIARWSIQLVIRYLLAASRAA